MLYGSEARGYYKLKKCDKIQYRVMRFFLGVHKFTPTIGLQGDMGWVSLSLDRHVSMVRFWNRLMSMNSDRLSKHIFLWDYELNNNNWSFHIRNILESSNNIVNFNLKRECKINNVRDALRKQFIAEHMLPSRMILAQRYMLSKLF